MDRKAEIGIRIPSGFDHASSYHELLVAEFRGARYSLIFAAKYGLRCNGADTNTKKASFAEITNYTQSKLDLLENGEIDTDVIYSTIDADRFQTWKTQYKNAADFYVLDLEGEDIQTWSEATQIFYMFPKRTGRPPESDHL